MRACRSAIWLIAMLGLVCLPALGTQHAQVGPQIITLTTNPAPLNQIKIYVPNTIQLYALQSFFEGAPGAPPETAPASLIGTKYDLTDEASWSCGSDCSIASVNPNTGLVTALADGPATITATYGRLTGSVQITVVGLNSVAITPNTTTSVPIGDLAQFTATGKYTDSSTADLTDQVVWTSTDSTHFPITNGNPGGGGVVKVEVGTTSGSTALISCILAAVSCTPANVTVQAATATVDFVVVTPRSTLIAAVGGTKIFTANCLYSDGVTMSCAGDSNHTAVTVNWSSGGATTGDTGSAMVAPLVGPTTTALATGNGTVTITAAPLFGTCRGSACLGKIDIGLTSMSTISPATPAMPKGSTRQFTIMGTFTGQAGTTDITNYVTWCTTPVATTNCFSTPRPLPVNVSIVSATGLATAVGAVGTSSTIFGGIDPCTMSTQTGLFCMTTSASVVAPVLATIAITPTSTSLPLGAKRQYTATGTYTDNSTANITSSVTWNSSNPGLSGGGDFNSAKPGQLLADTTPPLGSTMITAKQGAITSNAVTVNITPAVLSSITLAPKNPSVPTGDIQTFTATGKWSDGATHALPFPGDSTHVAIAAPSWSSSSPNAATVDSNGNATAIGTNGTTTIKATSGTVVGSTVLTVAPAVLKTITITAQAPSTLYVDGTVQYIATGTYSDNSTQDLTTTVNWTTTNGTGSATISNNAGSEGVATGVTAGSVTITASYMPQGATQAVTGALNTNVLARNLQSITVTPATVTLPPNQTQQYTATGTYNVGPNEDITGSVTWASADQIGTGVATIDASGLATTVNPGTANITANQGAVTSQPATLTVSSVTLLSITITPTGNNVVVPINSTQQFTATGNYSDGSTQDLSSIATWSLFNANLNDSIDNTGLYTAGKTPGSQKVTATCAGGSPGPCGNTPNNNPVSFTQPFTVTF